MGGGDCLAPVRLTRSNPVTYCSIHCLSVYRLTSAEVESLQCACSLVGAMHGSVYGEESFSPRNSCRLDDEEAELESLRAHAAEFLLAFSLTCPPDTLPGEHASRALHPRMWAESAFSVAMVRSDLTLASPSLWEAKSAAALCLPGTVFPAFCSHLALRLLLSIALCERPPPTRAGSNPLLVPQSRAASRMPHED